MKKKIASLLLMIVGLSAMALSSPQRVEQRRSFLRGDVLDVELHQAGTLNEYLGAGEDRRVRCIRLSGVMDGDDAKFIRKLCERSKAVDENDRGVDNYIDLELDRVKIVSGSHSERDVISNSMFSGCRNLRYVALPRNLRRIGSYAFYGCYNLEEVRFTGRSNLSEIGDHAFSGCSDLSHINLPEGLEVIGDNSFSGCSSLRRIDLPSTLREIGDEAFRDVPLTDVRLPNLLVTLGCNVFKGTKITSLYLPRDVKIADDAIGSMPKLREVLVERGSRNYSTEDGVLYDATGEVLIYYPNAKTGSFAVPSGVTTLLNASFAGCVSLTAITFPQSLTTIGTGAFTGCTSLGNVVIPTNVRKIGDRAFAGCNKMTTATIDAGITTLMSQTFQDCSSLNSVVLPQSLETIGERCFNECKSLVNVEWGGSLRTIMKEAFRKCGFVQLEFPSGVTMIGENAMRDCKSLQSTVLPSNLAVVEKELFRGCDNLVSVMLPVRASTIGENAFRDCKSLPAISLPEGLTTINNNAFRGTALTELVLPASILKIGDKILEKCKIKSIVCNALVPPVLTKISDKKTPLFVPGSSVEAYKNAKPWKDFKNISGKDY